MRSSISCFLPALLATAAVSVVSTTALGGVTVPPALDFYMQVNGGEAQEFYPEGTQTGPDTWNWYGQYGDSSSDWQLNYDINGDIDPQITNNLVLINNSGVTNIYSITVILPTIAVPGASLMDGSVGGSVTDANGDGFAQAAALPGDSIYTGLIDFAPVATLLDSPYAATVGISGGTSAIGPASFGQPVPIGGPGVVGNIGIRITFSLTAGDSIAITSFFRVNPVPAPGGLAVLGLLGVCTGRRRRR